MTCAQAPTSSSSSSSSASVVVGEPPSPTIPGHWLSGERCSFQPQGQPPCRSLAQALLTSPKQQHPPWLHQAAALGLFLCVCVCLGKDIIQMYTVYFYTLDRPVEGRVVHVWHCSILFFFFFFFVPAVCLEPFLFCLKQCCLLLIFIYDFVHRLHPF